MCTSVVRDQVQLKRKALQRWKFFGKAFGLEQSKNKTSARDLGPSDPNDSTRYWRAPQRCSLKSCPCSCMSRALHRLRVCKGCYRVLYCSRDCQRTYVTTPTAEIRTDDLTVTGRRDTSVYVRISDSLNYGIKTYKSSSTSGLIQNLSICLPTCYDVRLCSQRRR